MNEFKGIEIDAINFGNRMEFDSLGTPYRSSNTLLASEGIITLQTQDGSSSKTVRIEPATGKVKIQ